MKRRSFAGACVGALTTLAGCPSPPSTNTTNNKQATETNSTEPINTNQPLPTLSCNNETYSQLPVVTDFGNVTYNSTRDWQLSLSQETVTSGDAITIILQNTSPRKQQSASKWNYNLQLYTTNGWQEIRYTDTKFTFPDTSITQSPDGTFIWRFLITNNEFIGNTGPYKQHISFCSGLPKGTYRFVFQHPAIAAKFTIQ